ncbi:MAG: TetR/AcrR family transcriptional regulator C-terminal domain-containing protein [Oscillospiraceae bacterium]
MTYAAVSLNTKKMLAAALKNAMNSKPLSRITVSEIVQACGVNRKTFYYHFQDIYALLKWTLEQEAVEVVKNFDLMADAEDAMSFVIDYVTANQHMLNCAYDSMGRAEMQRFLYADFIEIISAVIDRAEAEAGLQVDADFKQFLADFYTEALVGMLINLFTGDFTYKREDIPRNITLILKAAIPQALRRREEETP